MKGVKLVFALMFLAQMVDALLEASTEYKYATTTNMPNTGQWLVVTDQLKTPA